MNGARRASPPSAWALALALSIPIAAPLFIPFLSQTPSEQFYRHELAEFLKSAPGERNYPMGVMLTASGGNCATVGPQRLTANGAGMYVVKHSSGRSEDFQDLLDVLVNNHPDFVVIQDLVLTPPHPAANKNYQQARSDWRNLLVGLAQELHLLTAEQNSDRARRCSTALTPQEFWPDIVQRAMRHVRPYSDPQQRKIMNFLGAFPAAGIPVLVASPPQNEFTAGYRSKLFLAVSHLVQQDNSMTGVSLHRQPVLTPGEKFLDPLHLNPDENQAYRAWLNGEIMNALGVQNH